MRPRFCIFLFSCLIFLHSFPSLSLMHHDISCQKISTGAIAPAKSSTLAEFDVVDVSGWPSLNSAITDHPDLFLLMSLEGLVNHDAPNLYVSWGGVVEQWWQELNATPYYRATVLNITSIEELVDHYAGYYDRVVVFNKSLPEVGNIATPLCGIHKALLFEESLYENARTWPAISGLPVAVNLTHEYALQNFSGPHHYNGTAFTPRVSVYQWAFNKWSPQCNQSSLAMCNPQWQRDIRSFLCGNGIFTTWEPMYCTYVDGGNPANTRYPDNPEEQAFFEYILASTPSNMSVHGYYACYGCNEHPVVTRITAASKYFLPTTLVHDLPFFHNLPIPDDFVFDQAPSRNFSMHVDPGTGKPHNKVYVAPILSDGDNLQFVQLGMKTWYWDYLIQTGSTTPITFEMSSSFYTEAPAMAMIYYMQQTEHQYFVTGINGWSYSKTRWATSEWFEYYWHHARELMAALDQREMRSWDAGDMNAVVRILNGQDGIPPQCDAFFEGYFGDGYVYPGTYQDVPFMPMMLLSGTSEAELSEERDRLLAMARSKPSSSPLFVVFHVNCWGISMPVYEQFVENMTRDSGNQVVFVTAGQLSGLMNLSKIVIDVHAFVWANIFVVAGLCSLAGVAKSKVRRVPASGLDHLK